MKRTKNSNVNILLVFWFSQWGEREHLAGIGNNIFILFNEHKKIKTTLSPFEERVNKINKLEV